jgi:hypothetical protein
MAAPTRHNEVIDVGVFTAVIVVMRVPTTGLIVCVLARALFPSEAIGQILGLADKFHELGRGHAGVTHRLEQSLPSLFSVRNDRRTSFLPHESPPL